MAIEDPTIAALYRRWNSSPTPEEQIYLDLAEGLVARKLVTDQGDGLLAVDYVKAGLERLKSSTTASRPHFDAPPPAPGPRGPAELSPFTVLAALDNLPAGDDEEEGTGDEPEAAPAVGDPTAPAPAIEEPSPAAPAREDPPFDAAAWNLAVNRIIRQMPGLNRSEWLASHWPSGEGKGFSYPKTTAEAERILENAEDYLTALKIAAQPRKTIRVRRDGWSPTPEALGPIKAIEFMGQQLRYHPNEPWPMRELHEAAGLEWPVPIDPRVRSGSRDKVTTNSGATKRRTWEVQTWGWGFGVRPALTERNHRDYVVYYDLEAIGLGGMDKTQHSDPILVCDPKYLYRRRAAPPTTRLHFHKSLDYVDQPLDAEHERPGDKPDKGAPRGKGAGQPRRPQQEQRQPELLINWDGVNAEAAD